MSAFGSLDTGFPMFNAKMTTEQKLKAVEDYLVQMLEQLRYTLNNLGAENFNEQSMNDIAKVISKPIIAEINDPENGLAARIEAVADSITAQVQGGYADAWVTNHAYYTSDVVKVETTSGNTTDIRFYKCIDDHTSSATTKPGSGSGWSSKWVEVTAPNVQSMISANLEGVSLSYDPDHSGVGTNEVYLTLNKDGVQMGGGKVKIEDLDAGTITAGSISADRVGAGTLDADLITLKNAFKVKTKTPNNQDIECGSLGGTYSEYAAGQYVGGIVLGTEVGSSNQSTDVLMTPNSLMLSCSKYRDLPEAYINVRYTPQGYHTVEISRYMNGQQKTIDLFNLEQRVTALENA